MQNWILAFAAVTSFSAIGFTVVGVMWLRKLRETVSNSLTESAHQQIRTAQRLGEALAEVQKQQKQQEQQMLLLAQANSQLRQGLANVAVRMDPQRAESTGSEQTIH